METEQSATFTVTAPISDTVPPTTTSSFNPAAGAIYKTAQPVTLSASDTGGSGLKATYYRIDAAPYSTGTTFSVVSDGLHTFDYFSADNANNTETVHPSNQFRIDTIPPVTTNSAIGGSTYTGAQLFTLAASDINGSGVASTWYQLDGGAWTVGTLVAVAAPGVGSESHTINWYSFDIATNQETTTSVTFTVSAPVSGGTTTLSFRTNAIFGGWSYVHWEVLDAMAT